MFFRNNRTPSLLLINQGNGSPEAPVDTVPVGGQRLFTRESDGHLCRIDENGIITDLEMAGGDVFGPASSVDNRIAVFNLTTGKLIKDGGQTIADVIAAGSGGSGLVLLADNTLGADTGTVSFTSIPGTYKHLRLIGYGRLTEATTSNYVYVQFNGDTGSNYDEQRIAGNGSGAVVGEAFAQTKSRVTEWPGASSSSASQAGLFELNLPYYANTSFFKNWTAEGGAVWGTSTGTMVVRAHFGNYRSTSAIAQIDFLPATGDFKAGSRFTLYGFN